MHFALVLTNVASVDGTWTSMHLGAAILRAGHQLSILEPPDFEVTEAHHLVARVWAADAEPKSVADLARAVSQHRLPRRYVTIRQIDRLLMRVNPLSPAASQFCLLAKESGVMVVNDPAGVARTRAKAWLATLPADVPHPVVKAELGRAGSLRRWGRGAKSLSRCARGLSCRGERKACLPRR